MAPGVSKREKVPRIIRVCLMLWELKLDHNGGDLLRSLTSFPVRMIDQTRTNCRPNKIPARILARR